MGRIRRVLLVLALAAPAAAPAQTTSVGQQSPENAQLERATSHVASQLRCPVCQGLSIEDSPSDMARDMRGIVKEQLAAGKSEEEVKAYFVRGYGEWILQSPRAEGFNLVVYVLPIAALFAGGVTIVVLTRRWTRGRPPGPPMIAGDDPDLAPWDDIPRP